MGDNSDRVFPPAVRRTQAERGAAARHHQGNIEGFPDRMTPELAAFLAEQDSAFLATASADGAPYVPHRGGPKGFLKALDDRKLGFADYRGNRQYITVGDLSENDRACLLLLDATRRQRVKLWGRARMVEGDATLLEKLFTPSYRVRPERAFLFTIDAWDPNCSAHITAHFSESEVAEALALLTQKIAALEADNARLRTALHANAPGATSKA